MKNNTDTAGLAPLTNEAGYDPIEDRLRENTANATRSRAASPVSRTDAALQPATTDARRSSCQFAPSPPSSCSGYES